MSKGEDAASRPEPLSPTALAWLLLPAALVVAVPLVLLLAPPLGDLLFPNHGVHYWPGEPSVRKPSIQAGYPLAAACVVAYAAAIVVVARRRPALPPRTRRLAVAVVQALGLALLVACWVAQRHVTSLGTRRVYFTTATVLVAALLTGLAVAALTRRERVAAWARRLPRPSPRAVAIACAAVALLATCVWALSGVYTDHSLVAAPDALFLGAWFFDETTAVLNGRTPLVNMAAYGYVWPYVAALPLRVFGGTYLAYTATMMTLTGASLLALYWTFVRVTRRALAALALYLPVLATAFFVEIGTPASRYSPGTYYGMFPLRYAGPFLLVLATTLHLGAARSRRTTVLLFAGAGLVLLNNLDFGLSALLGTLAALALTQRPLERRALGRLALDAGLGVLAALALVSALTLIRSGSLPHLGLLTRYGHYFVVGGQGNLALPGLGLHVAIALTFVAALATAAVRAATGERDVVLTGALAWTGVFGLGACAYYFAYRSHPLVLINLFPAWALGLALLVVVVVRTPPVGRRVGPSGVVVLFGFALLACSLAQVPTPWSQAQRLEGKLEAGQRSYLPADAFRGDAVARTIATRTRQGERVVIFSPVGHRIARAAGVIDVSPYPGLGQMPAREQFAETLDQLAAEGGDAVFLAEPWSQDQLAALAARGFQPVGQWRLRNWPVGQLLEYRRSAGAPSQ
ncbi:MAG: hypothetical protein JSS99_05210 [Actinobacteria bacterium]|nr:hypothetical protein [Actinomycetota bacterium]